MMKYELKELPAFSVIGLERELTNQKSENLARCLAFWPIFNRQLKIHGLSQPSENWTKFAFMERHQDRLFYFCAIPSPMKRPVIFQSKEFSAGKYLVVEHQGAMDQIYQTYDMIYRELIPSLAFSLDQTDFLHFEKYGEKFHWNRPSSVIEIWVPIK